VGNGVKGAILDPVRGVADGTDKIVTGTGNTLSSATGGGSKKDETVGKN